MVNFARPQQPRGKFVSWLFVGLFDFFFSYHCTENRRYDNDNDNDRF